MRRRHLLTLMPALALAGCGFKLRQAPEFAFRSIFLDSAAAGALGGELRRALATADHVQVLTAAEARAGASVVFELLAEKRERVTVGLNVSGQVREFELRLQFSFRVRTPQGKELISATELQQRRELSYTESSALAKEAEEILLWNAMQKDLARQVLHRLEAVRAL